MNIEEVEALYLRDGFESIAVDYRNIVLTFLLKQFSEAIPNDDYLHALFLTDLMFRYTKREIRIISGCRWIVTLSETLRRTLRRIKANQGFLRVICLSKEPIPTLRDLSKEFGNSVVQYEPILVSRPIKHLIVCDDRMLRKEEIHPPITPQMSSDAIKAEVYFHNGVKARALRNFFDSVWHTICHR